MPAKSKKTQTPVLLPPKVDVVFKMLFGDKRNVNILKDFLEAVLHLEPNALKTIILRDPYLKKEYVVISEELPQTLSHKTKSSSETTAILRAFAAG